MQQTIGNKVAIVKTKARGPCIGNRDSRRVVKLVKTSELEALLEAKSKKGKVNRRKDAPKIRKELERRVRVAA